MAEFCKECFIKIFCPTEEEIKQIVLSEDDDYCEGCNEFKPIVEYLTNDKN